MVSDIEDHMSAIEFREWIAYDRIDPLPRPWQQTGTIAAAVVNQWSKTRVHPSDFIPAAPAPPKRLTPAEQTALFRSLANGHAG